MATEYKKLVLRRGTGTPPTDLLEGELAYQTDTGKLFVGTGNASPNHYAEIVTTLAELGIDADAADINKLNNLATTAAELGKLSGFTGTVDDLNYAKELNATGVQASEFGLLDGVTGNIQTQLDNVKTPEWFLVQEINILNTSTSQTDIDKVIDSTALGENFDNGAYDYKFVIDGFTSSPETASEPFFRFNQDATAGKYSFVNSLTRVGTSNTATNTLTGNSGDSGTSITTGLDLTTAANQGNITVSQIEVVVTRSNAGVSGFYGYHLRGEGSIIAAESTQTVGSTYSLSAIAQFTGSFGGTTAQSLTSFDIHNLPGAGDSDSAKIRIYKRQR